MNQTPSRESEDTRKRRLQRVVSHSFTKGQEVSLDEIYDIQSLAGGDWWRRKDETNDLDEEIIIKRNITIKIRWNG